MKHQRVTIVVFGLRTYVGREIARFGRAMGHRIVAVVDEIPPFDAPWMHGIHWTRTEAADIDSPFEGPPTAIVYCDTALWDGGRGRFRQVLFERPRYLLRAVSSWDHPPRFVYRSTPPQSLLPSGFTAYARRMENEMARSALSSVILRLPLLYGPDRPDSVAAMMMAESLRRLPLASITSYRPATMRVETAALAALRGCLEPDIQGILDPEDVARIGDVMIPQ